MNPSKILLSKDLMPVYWFVSLPHLYGCNKFYDIYSGKAASIPGSSTTRALWKPFSSKPGYWAGPLSTVGRTAPSSLDIAPKSLNRLSVSFWCNFSSFGSSAIIMRTTTNDIVYTSGNFSVVGALTNTGTYSINSNLNKWVHLCLVMPSIVSTTHSLYINGVLDVSFANTYGTSITTLNFFNSGGGAGTANSQTSGDIDDILIFNNILTPEMVQKIYQSSFNRNKFKYDIWSEAIASNSNSNLLSMIYGGQF